MAASSIIQELKAQLILNSIEYEGNAHSVGTIPTVAGVQQHGVMVWAV